MQIVKPKWHEIMTNSKYFDVIILSSDNIEIPAHRCFLDKFSQKFADIIAESKEIPVKINIEKFNAEIIKASLEFLYDKLDSILGKESQVFKFATEYSIEILKETCCSHFEKTVNSENVCEFIQIAYNNGFEELKQKCQKHIALNKKDIDSTKLKELPKEIIVDIFCS
uniref:BTB domain-containing protein n=1 Tax=Panagrolaimus superbus TaxID=310955 RepID=A0A914ZDD4_9BILA